MTKEKNQQRRGGKPGQFRGDKKSGGKTFSKAYRGDKRPPRSDDKSGKPEYKSKGKSAHFSPKYEGKKDFSKSYRGDKRPPRSDDKSGKPDYKSKGKPGFKPKYEDRKGFKKPYRDGNKRPVKTDDRSAGKPEYKPRDKSPQNFKPKYDDRKGFSKAYRGDNKRPPKSGDQPKFGMQDNSPQNFKPKFDRKKKFSKKYTRPSKPDAAMSAEPSANKFERPRNKPERIAKVLAHAGLCSRREAEQWILEGRVSVDGEVLKTPAKVVSPVNKIMVNNRPFIWKNKVAKLWLYHKAPGFVVSHNDPEGRPTIFDILPRSLPRVLSVGRLDLNSEGLILLTNDGGLSRYLELPATGLRRQYRVRVYGTVTPEIIERLAKGIVIEGMVYAPIIVEIDKATGRNAWLFVTLTEGKNREIRNVMEYFGLTVNRLVRTAYGPFELRDLPQGRVNEITSDQLKKLLPGYFGS